MKPYRRRGTKYTESHRLAVRLPRSGRGPPNIHSFSSSPKHAIIWRMIFCSEFMTSSTPSMSVTRLTATTDSETNRVRATCTCCIICFATCIMHAVMAHAAFSWKTGVTIHSLLLVSTGSSRGEEIQTAATSRSVQSVNVCASDVTKAAQ